MQYPNEIIFNFSELANFWVAKLSFWLCDVQKVLLCLIIRSAVRERPIEYFTPRCEDCLLSHAHFISIYSKKNTGLNIKVNKIAVRRCSVSKMKPQLNQLFLSIQPDFSRPWDGIWRLPRALFLHTSSTFLLSNTQNHSHKCWKVPG